MMMKIRASSLPSFNDCARRAAAQLFKDDISWKGYELRELPLHVGAILGTAAHKGVELKLTQLQETDSRAIDCAINHFTELSCNSNAIITDNVTPNNNVAHKQIANIIMAYCQQVYPTIRPVKTEQRYEGNISSLDVTLTGTVDCITDDSIDDLKTGGNAGKNIAQLGAYSLLEHANGGNVNNIREINIPRMDTLKEQQVDYHLYDKSTAEIEAYTTIKHVKGYYDAFMDNGNPAEFPANPASMLCSAKYCAAHGTKFCRVKGN